MLQIRKLHAGRLCVDRLKYELCVLQVLRGRLRCKEIWVVGANRYRNPDEDLPRIDIRDNCVTVASRMEATNFVG